MARKKQEIALQSEIETQEEWEDMLTKEGVTGRNFKQRHFTVLRLFRTTSLKNLESPKRKLKVPEFGQNEIVSLKRP